MKLHQLPKTKKRVQRIGRGGKRGTTAGRGTKGQKSRAGNRRRPAERDLIQRLPKLRGFRNKPKSSTTRVFNLHELVASLPPTTKGSPEITKESLQAVKLLSKNFKGTIKILGDGEITVPIVVKGISVSASARVKIEKAGGTIADGK